MRMSFVSLLSGNQTLAKSHPWPSQKSFPRGIDGALLEGDGSGAPGGAKGWTAERAGAGGIEGIRMTRRPRRQFST